MPQYFQFDRNCIFTLPARKSYSEAFQTYKGNEDQGRVEW